MRLIGVLAVVLRDTVVRSLARLCMSADLEASGLSQADAASLMGEIQSSSTSVDLMSPYAAPVSSGVETDEVIAESIPTGLHVNGLLGALLALAGVFLVRGRRRG